MKTLLEMVREERAALVAPADELIAKAEAEARNLTAEEFSKVQEVAAATKDIDERIATLVAKAERDAVAVRETPGIVRVKSEPRTYDKHTETSYFRDLGLRALASQGADVNRRLLNEATDRLQRYNREVEVEQRAGDTGDTAGGTFVPPLWLVNEYVPYFRAGRVVADLARSMPLPSGTDSINIPTITTGTLTAIQATENSAATTRDLVTSSTTAEVTTVAGYYDSSLQLLEQSALAAGFDALVFGDLIKDRNRATDVYVLSGTGTNNQPVGLVTAAGTTITTTTAAATALYGNIADGIQRVATTRFDTPEVIIMHPRRWYWLVSRYDSQGRPLVTPDAQAGMNLLASYGITAAQGAVGTMLGLPVVIDPNVATTTSTYFDDVLIWKPSDAVLMEGAPKLEVFRDVLSSTLGVRFRLYNYMAFSTRTTKAVCYLTGAGLTGPSF